MDSELRKLYIQRDYKMLKSLLLDAQFHGEPLDLEDPMEVAVALWHVMSIWDFNRLRDTEEKDGEKSNKK